MSMNIYTLMQPLLWLLLFATGDCWALGQVSRACRFIDIPNNLKAVALDFFHIIGAAPLGKYNYLITASVDVQSSAVILESLTTDTSVRYYLYAENIVYQENYMPNTHQLLGYSSYTAYTSNDWIPEKVPDDVSSMSRLDVFFHNRGPLFSVRAGDPEIITQYAYPSYLAKPFKVVGQHAYYDPVAKRTVPLPSTTAYDCNLGQWGFGDR